MNFQGAAGFLGLLLVASVLVSQLASSSAQMEDGGSGSGGGSGDSGISCRRPEDPIVPSKKEALVMREVKCHLACIDEVSQFLFLGKRILWLKCLATCEN